MKKTIKRAIKVFLFAASCLGVFCIFGGGWHSFIGVLSVLYMAFTTIATAIDEARDEA